MRPFDVEIDVVRAPDDQGRRLELPQPPLDRDGVPVVEGCEEASEVVVTLLVVDERARICPDVAVANPLRFLVGRAQSLCRAVTLLSVSIALSASLRPPAAAI